VVLKIEWFWSVDLRSVNQQINMPGNACAHFVWLRVLVHCFLLVQKTETRFCFLFS